MKKYLYSLDYLRGFAAISVCLFHFTDKLDYLSNDDPVKEFLSFGHFGVEIFFIISGLVIPYSMAKGNYSIEKFGIFIKKRFIRIEPPYLLCVLLCLLLKYLTTINPYYSGDAFSIDYAQVFYHIGYLNGFMGKDWLNQVFWTLAVEFQYYLLIALIFPIISHKKSYVWITTLIGFNILSFYMDRNYVFNFSIFFSAGIVLYRYFVDKLQLWEILLAISAIIAFVVFRYSYKELIVVILTTIVILIPLKPTTWGSFFGNISYSLYLLHFPIGLRVINLTQRFSSEESVRYMMILGAFLFSVGVSYVYYRIVEKPFKDLSHKIKYNEKEVTELSGLASSR